MERLNEFDCETAYRSRKITKKTQRYANSTVKKETKKQTILGVLQYGPATVREIIAVLYKEGKIKTRDRNEVAPRITELAEDGIVEAFEQKKDSVTGKPVAVYRLVEEKDGQERCD